MGKIRCSNCRQTALLYDDDKMPHYRAQDSIKASHFKMPRAGDAIVCFFCGNEFLLDDIRKEWKRLQPKEWDL